MGSCLSKKGSPPPPPPSSSNLVAVAAPAAVPPPLEPRPSTPQKEEVFLIKHRKSNDKDRDSSDSSHLPAEPQHSSGLRTSNCTKEEVDAILIQCGRLSRSSSANFPGRSYSGSKRSYDFDNHEDADAEVAASVPGGCQFPDSNEDDPARRRPHRRQSRPSPTRDHAGRRRTPSRERDQQRSSSATRERRMSRSPARRGDSNATNPSLSNAPVNSTGSKLPAKMVSVPASVSSGTDKTKINVEPKTAAVRRISVKRNQCSGDATRAAASPRSQSPVKQSTSIAKTADNDGQQQPQPQQSLSRSSSRKAEKSPYRRNPLGEIDPSTFPPAANHKYHAAPNKENEAAQVKAKPSVVDKRKGNMDEDARTLEEGKASSRNIPRKETIIQASAAVDVGLDDIHQALARIKSTRDFEAEKDNQQAYTSLLLQDIQKFHQKQAAPPSFSLPPCVVKACSIYDAVAGLNSKRSCIYDNPTTFSGRIIGTGFMDAKSEAKDPFVETELAVDDDLMEPSILKYVTVKRGGGSGGMLGREEEEESSGSNTLFLGSEPAFSDSPNCGTSISAGTRTSAIKGVRCG